MTNYDEGSDNPTGRSSGVAPYHQYSTETDKGRILPQSESETEIIVAEDDAVILTDGGETPNLTGGTTGASEKSDIQADQKYGFRVRSKLTSEIKARQLRNEMLRAGINPDKIELVKERVEVDPR